MMTNSDLNRIINSDEIQSVVNQPKESDTRKTLKKNPLKNLGSMLKLNPYAKTAKRMAILADEKRKVAKTAKVDAKRKATAQKAHKATKPSGKAFHKAMLVDSEFQGDDYDNFSNWLTQGHEA